VSIVFLSSTGQMGGAEAALVEALAGLRESQPSWPLSLIVASDGPLVARVQALGVSVQVLSFPPSLMRLGDWGLGPGLSARSAFLARCAGSLWPTWWYVLRLRKALRAQRPAVVHTNGFKMHILGALACPPGSALLWHMHDYLSRRTLMARLLRRYAARCSAVIANSCSVAEDVQSVCGSSLPVYPVWNAVDLERFSPVGAALDLDALAGLPTAGALVRVGLVATFARWKGHRTFLDALAMLPPSLPVRGYVIGGPIYETTESQVTLDELRRHAASLGLGNRIGFTGRVSDTAAAMRALDVVVHASVDPEPFGLVIAEAMACGRPVVSSGAGGARELVQPGVNALVHMPGHAQSLARSIETAVMNAALRSELAKAGRLTAERSFTRRRLANELAPIYNGLVHAH
jgi:glycosyltransferase involved in cell wall biosynthesis